MSNDRYSVILPVFNEAENLPALYQRLTAVMKGIEASYELIFVDDGSQDDSLAIIRQFHQIDTSVKCIQLSRNFGHQNALSAGLSCAQGDAVILMDTDLQDAPEDIPRLIAPWQAGYHVVYAVRQARKEGVFKRVAYYLFYRLLQTYAEIKIPLDSGDFSLMDRRVVDTLNNLPEKARFIRGLRAWAGFKQIGVPVERSARLTGSPKYHLKHLIHLAMSGFLSFSVAPLRLASALGLTVSMFSFVSIFIVVYLRLFTQISLPGFAATASILFFLGGVQLVTIGILGEYIGKIFDEVKNRPAYLVAESLGDLPRVRGT